MTFPSLDISRVHGRVTYGGRSESQVSGQPADPNQRHRGWEKSAGALLRIREDDMFEVKLKL